MCDQESCVTLCEALSHKTELHIECVHTQMGERFTRVQKVFLCKTWRLTSSLKNIGTPTLKSSQRFSSTLLLFFGTHSKKLSFSWEWGAYFTTEILTSEKISL